MEILLTPNIKRKKGSEDRNTGLDLENILLYELYRFGRREIEKSWNTYSYTS